MVESSTVSYYLPLIGGSFTVLTGTLPTTNYWAFPAVNLIILGSAIIILVFGHHGWVEKEQRLGSSVLVTVMSLIAWLGVLVSRPLFVADLTIAGPFLSFAGGIIGLSGSLGKEVRL